uniref:rhomboid protease n=1 Tax=Plectus sambesii TaxID=2011161 RepID=A0A914WTR6_9BILA
MAPRAAHAKVRHLREAFDALDVDHDGRIPLNELKLILSASNVQVRLNDQQIEALLDEADTNQDGSFDFKEFALLTTSKQVQPSRMKRMLYRVADTVTATADQPVVHSYLDSYNCCPPPLFIILISLAQIGVFVGYTLSSGTMPNWLTGCSGCFVDGEEGPLMFAPHLRQQAWRFLSYMFLHAGISHIAGNLIFQILLGIPLELVHKAWRIGPIYLLAVVLGAVLQYVLDPTVYLVGASAGVYALITAHLANVVLNWSEMPFRWFRILACAAFIGLDVGQVIYRRFFADECDNVSYTAHIGGAITGLLMGFVLLHNINVISWERVLFWVALGLYVIVFLICVVMVIFVQPESDPIWSVQCAKESNQ